MALEFSRSPPHPLACGETLSPQVEKGKRARPTLSFPTFHDLRSTGPKSFSLSQRSPRRPS